MREREHGRARATGTEPEKERQRERERESERENRYERSRERERDTAVPPGGTGRQKVDGGGNTRERLRDRDSLQCRMYSHQVPMEKV